MVNDWLYGCIVGWSVHLNWFEHIIYMFMCSCVVWMVKEHFSWKWFCYYYLCGIAFGAFMREFDSDKSYIQ